MAHYENAGLTVVSRSEVGKGKDFTGGPRDPRITTNFMIVGDNPRDVALAAVNSAEGDGWIFETDEGQATGSGDTSWWAEKELPEGLAALNIILRVATADVDLTIRLSFKEEF